MQMVFHKTVVALEWSLKEALTELFSREPSSYNADAIESSIKNGEWCQFDDGAILNKFKIIEKDSNVSELTRAHIHAVLYRRPAKRLWISERMGDQLSWNEIKAQTSAIEDSIKSVSEHYGIEIGRFKLIKRNFNFVDIGSARSIECSDEEKARSIKILNKGVSTMLVEDRALLINQLSNMSNQALSIYYLPRPGEQKSFRIELASAINKALL